METQEGSWIVVVPPTRPRAAAQKEFERWKHENPLWAARLGELDVLVDVIRGLEGRTLFRISVKDVGFPRP